MTLEGFVRASGAVMGLARESFGPGGSILLAPAGIGAAPAAPSASGQAADGAGHDSGRVHTDVTALDGHDQAGGRELSGAAAAAGTGRNRMDAVIDAAMADVSALGLSADTPQGQSALVDAIKRHLEETKITLDTAGADAGTRAAAANTTAAGYNGIGAPVTPAMMMPAQAMGSASGMPSVPMPGLPMGGLPLGPLTSLGGLVRSGGGEPEQIPAGASSGGMSDIPDSGLDAPPGSMAYIGADGGLNRTALTNYIVHRGHQLGMTPTEIRMTLAVAQHESSWREPGFMGFGPEAKNVGMDFDRNPLGAIDRFLRQYTTRLPAGLDRNSPNAVADYVWHRVHAAADPNYGPELLACYREIVSS